MAASMPPPQGYDALAKLISQYPDLSIFRQFTELNAVNLLDLQAEIIHLKRQLQVITYLDEATALKCPKDDSHAVTILHLKGVDGENCPYHQRIWQLKLEIRQALAKYNEAHLHYEHLTSHRKAPKRELKALRTWFGHEKGGRNFLQGWEDDIWSEDAEADLACFSGRKRETDLLSRLLSGPILQWCHNRFARPSTSNSNPHSLNESQVPPPPDVLGPLLYFPDSYVSYTVNAVSTILASLLPTVPVFLLYYIHDDLARMGAIVGVVLMFSTLVTVFTNAKRSEVFTVATALTAVLVTFVGNVGGACNGVYS